MHDAAAQACLPNWRTPVLLANWRLQRANLDREIDFLEGNPHGPDETALKELRALAAELDRLIGGCFVEKSDPATH
jgi:hypothetical protein